ncbi:MAG: maltokinase, partial [Gaiellales bacterium]|nr:maltokinase [Gaiellales bacterium]
MTPESTLTPLLGAQRWFGSKARTLAGGRVVDSEELAPGCVLALFRADFAEGGDELYQLPMRLNDDGAPELSLADPVLAHGLLAALRSGQPIASLEGSLEFALTGPLPEASALVPVRAVGGEQSNSSVVFGGQVILKVYRRLQDGESTELELLRFLAGQGFEHTPRLLGWYSYAGASITATLGVLQAFVPDARDGWELALESFGDPAPFLPHLRRLGEVTARMHSALAGDADDPAFRPEPLGSGAAESSEAEARDALEALEPGGGAEPVRARTADVLERLRSLHRAGTGGQAIRQHGDYHLGQVLWAGGDWLVLDFEGEPARPLAERRRKSSPLRDVAGMLRSFAYAAETVRSRGDAPAGDWERDARAAFLAGYDAKIDQALLPSAGVARASLLAACELEKALYELRYELNNRPDWV